MIEPTYANLQKLFADRVFRIPAYQRFYSWQTRQRAELFSDITKLSTSAHEQHHFMATIVCSRTGETKAIGTAEYTVNDIVDKQMRNRQDVYLLAITAIAKVTSRLSRTSLDGII